MRLYSFKNKILLIVALALFLTMLLAYGFIRHNAAEPVTKTRFALDTVCRITLYGTSDKQIFDDCFQKISDIEKKMSVDLAESQASRINSKAGVAPVQVSQDTYDVICAGKKYSKMTSGDFDITVGPLVRLWGINKPDPKIPAEKDIQAKLKLINYKNIDLNDENRSVFLKEKGMSIDLGGIAKGYAGDAVVELLKSRGVQHAIVDLGGNLVMIGGKPDGTDWNVGIQEPFKPTGDSFAILSISDKAVVTSGIYQRYFKENGKIYHHILDTHTGYPVDNGLVSVTIVCEKSMEADALAKAFTLGLKKGMQFIESQKGVDAIFVTDKNEVYITHGLKGIFRITDDKYKLVN